MHAPGEDITAQATSRGLTGWLGRVLFVKPGEWRPLLFSAAYFFFVMFSYNMMKPVRDAMGVRGDLEELPWLFTRTLLAMLLVTPLYAAIASRFPRRTFIPWVYGFFIANMLAFYGLFRLLPESSRLELGYAFFNWVSVFNLFVVSVFWSFTADTFDPSQGKRLFGFIGVGGTMGVFLGAMTTGKLVKGIHFGAGHAIKLPPESMLLAACVPLALAVVCMLLVAASVKRNQASGFDTKPADREPSRSVWAGFRLIAQSPYLMLMCAYVFTYAVTNTFLYREQAGIIKHLFPDDAQRTAAFANVTMWTQGVTFAAQLIVTARAVRWLGVGGTLSVLPAFTMLGFVALWASPQLELAHQFQIVMMFQVVRSSLHYALDRPVRESLYTVLGPDAKYKSKNFIDTVIYRGGDQLGIWMPNWLARVSMPIATVAVPLAGAWIAIALVLGRWQRSRAGIAAEAATIPSVPTNPA
jgi:ATP:ADP antiporter, AAA family